jgi:hypothetical protein
VLSPWASKLAKLLEVFYLLEAGAFLLMAPWSRLWVERVVSRSPHDLQGMLHSPYFRGFIAGIGMLHIFCGLRELSLFRAPGRLAMPVPPRRTES